MTYVEWLRVRNLLRITAIVFGALILLAVILRLAFVHNGPYEQMISHAMSDPSTKVTRTTLPDGTPRTILENPVDQTRIVIDDRGYAGKHIVITEPAHGQHANDRVAVGSVHVAESHGRATITTTIDTNGATDFSTYAGIACFVSLILATILGAPFAREADGHLEIALTKPVSRETFALRILGVDALGIIAGWILTVIVGIIIESIFEVPRFGWGPGTGPAVVIAIVVPLAWYAMLTAFTASLKRGYGAVQGFAWPVGLVVAALATIPLGETPLARAIHGIFWVVSRFDPLTYGTIKGSVSFDASAPMAHQPDFAARIAIVTILMLVYGALAVIQWRRVEA